MILFHIDPTDVEPIYRQLVRQVHDAVLSGRLKPGEKLPSQREIASRLVINHLTVKRAYECLEREGLIEKRRGVGSFVCKRKKPALARARREELNKQLKELISTAHSLGYERKEVEKLIEEYWPERQRML